MNLENLKKITYDLKYPLDDLLINYREIAKRLKNKKLLDWIHKELNGYEKNEIPPYRFVTNNSLKYTIKNLKRSNMIGEVSIKSLKDLNKHKEVFKENILESEFLKNISYIGIDFGVTELHAERDRRLYDRSTLRIIIDDDERFTIDPEETAPHKQLPGVDPNCKTTDRLLEVVLDIGQQYKITNHIRIILQDFIDDLDKIQDWENNPITSILVDKTFTFNININNITNNITNRIDSGDGNIINNGNDNSATISKNDVIGKCLDIVESINTNNKNIEDLKLELIRALKDCEQEKLNSKPTILGKLCTIIMTSAAATADVATAMPLFTPLLTYLRG